MDNGPPSTAATTGRAVFEDGRWEVGRAMFCPVVMRVNIACSHSAPSDAGWTRQPEHARTVGGAARRATQSLEAPAPTAGT